MTRPTIADLLGHPRVRRGLLPTSDGGRANRHQDDVPYLSMAIHWIPLARLPVPAS